MLSIQRTRKINILDLNYLSLERMQDSFSGLTVDSLVAN